MRMKQRSNLHLQLHLKFKTITFKINNLVTKSLLYWKETILVK